MGAGACEASTDGSGREEERLCVVRGGGGVLLWSEEEYVISGSGDSEKGGRAELGGELKSRVTSLRVESVKE